MRQSILIALLFLSSVAWGVACPSGYAWIDTVTVAAQGSQSGNLTNQAELFTGNNAGFQTSGGHVLHSTWPLDIVPCTGPGTGTVIPFEIVPSSYNATAGTFEMWVSLPAINKSSTGTFYVMVGNASPSDLTCNQNNTAACTSVFTSCLSVQHMGFANGTTTGQVLFDSCANVSGTNHSSTKKDTTPFPPVYEGVNFANTQWFDTGETPGASITSFSLEAWIAIGTTNTNLGILGNLSGTTVGVDLATFTGGSCSANTCIQEQIATNSSNRTDNYTNFSYGTSGGTWHMYGLTYASGALGLPIIYNDAVVGTKVNNFSVGSPGDPGNSTSTWQMGSSGNATGTFIGNVDEARLYSVVLTADQILADFTFENNPTAQYTNSFAAAGTTRHRAWVIQSGN